MPVETVKIRKDEFGGFQEERIPSSIVALRICCAKNCSSSGKTQIAVPGGYRIVCGKHAVILYMMSLGILGDGSPVGEVKHYAKLMEVDWEELLKSEPKHPSMPEAFVCSSCSGRLDRLPPTADRTKRYMHVCPS
jgi:hypothetical protein